MLLEVSELAVDVATRRGLQRVVDRTSFSLDEGESLGVVGESGSGKTMTALALMALTPEGARASGSIRFEGRELVGLEEEELRQLRGDRIAMIFQEPMTALNPLRRVGAQVAEPLMLHRGLSKREAQARAVELLEHVRLAEPERAARSYPFQLSGGERQRAMIAMAIGCSPRLVIADEPTTALDVTVQARILALIDGLRVGIEDGDPAGESRSRGDRRALRTRHRHVRGRDHGERAGRGGVARAQKPVHAGAARGPTAAGSAARRSVKDHPRRAAGWARASRRLPFRRPMRAHHRRLPHNGAAGGRLRSWPCFALSSRPRSGVRAMSEAPLLEVSSLVKTYRSPGIGPFARKNARPALAGVSFSMHQGRSFGIVGEFGFRQVDARAHRARARPAGLGHRCAFRGARCSICRDANCGPCERICK